MTPEERRAYRASNRPPLRPATPWKVAVVRGLGAMIAFWMVVNVVVLVVYLAS